MYCVSVKTTEPPMAECSKSELCVTKDQHLLSVWLLKKARMEIYFSSALGSLQINIPGFHSAQSKAQGYQLKQSNKFLRPLDLDSDLTQTV